MRTIALLGAAVFFSALGQQVPTGSGPEAPKLDKATLRQQIADMKVKAFEIQTHIEMLERQLRETEEAEERALALKTSAKGNASGGTVKTRCAGTTRDGKRCTRPADPGSRFCWQHKVAHR